MDKHTTTSTLMEYLAPMNMEKVRQLIERSGLDRYTKKLDTLTFSQLFIYAQLHQIPSLTDISLTLNNNEDLQKELRLESISASQLSRKLAAIPASLLEKVFTHIVDKVMGDMGIKKGTQELGQINLIDASTISMCLSQYRWAEFRETKAGMKIHMRVVFCDDHVIPNKAVLTPAKPADKTQMDALVVSDPNALNVFDRGYVDYRKFDRYSEAGTRFVTRLKTNAQMTVIEEKTVDPDSPIDREAIVRLGNPYTYQMKHTLRLIETTDSEGNKITIITNDQQASAEEIGDLYRKRWQIELFFKWLKQHLKIKRFYGHSDNAVYNQIRIAMITFCLSLLMKRKTAYEGSLFHIHKLVRLCWLDPLNVFIRKLFKKPKKSRYAKGRQAWNIKTIFKETVEQYEKGEIDHLNDLTYDPII